MQTYGFHVFDAIPIRSVPAIIMSHPTLGSLHSRKPSSVVLSYLGDGAQFLFMTLFPFVPTGYSIGYIYH